MQNRAKTHALDDPQMDALLERVETGTLATINPDGTPYAAPVHFAMLDGKLYMHGAAQGQKIDNIQANPNVSFAAFDLQSVNFTEDGRPCGTSASYQSVIITGKAAMITDKALKTAALTKIAEKYSPQLAKTPMPDAAIEKTAVMEVTVTERTGKYN